MKKQSIDKIYTIYALIVTILILGFSWVVFESQVIFGAENSFSTEVQTKSVKPNDSLSETAKKIIDVTKRQIDNPKPKFENIKIELN